MFINNCKVRIAYFKSSSIFKNYIANAFTDTRIAFVSIYICFSLNKPFSICILIFIGTIWKILTNRCEWMIFLSC